MIRIVPALRGSIRDGEGWYSLRYVVLDDGRLAILRASFDVLRQWQENRKRMEERHDADLPPVCPKGTRASLSLFDGQSEVEQFEFGLEYPWMDFDRFPDGRWLMSAARCEPGENNAWIRAHSGAIESRLCLGDGLEHVQCDASGAIWVGYMDEGIFGNHGWCPHHLLDDVRLGINRFDQNGTMTWAFTADAVDDTYALNVARDAVWACYYPDFSIARIGYDGTVLLWENQCAGVQLIAVDGDFAVLFGGYGDDDNKGTLLRLTDRPTETRLTHCKTERVGEFEIDLGGAGARTAAYSSVRHDTLHFVEGSKWYSISVAHIAAALSS